MVDWGLALKIFTFGLLAVFDDRNSNRRYDGIAEVSCFSVYPDSEGPPGYSCGFPPDGEPILGIGSDYLAYLHFDPDKLPDLACVPEPTDPEQPACLIVDKRDGTFDVGTDSTNQLKGVVPGYNIVGFGKQIAAKPGPIELSLSAAHYTCDPNLDPFDCKHEVAIFVEVRNSLCDIQVECLDTPRGDCLAGLDDPSAYAEGLDLQRRHDLHDCISLLRDAITTTGCDVTQIDETIEVQCAKVQDLLDLK